MKKTLVLLCVLAAGGCSTWAGETAISQVKQAQDRIIVRFKADKARRFIKTGDKTPFKTLAAQTGLPAGAELDEGGFAKWARYARKVKTGKAAEPWEIDLSRFMILHVPAGTDADRLVDQLKKNPFIEHAAKAVLGRAAATIPNDTLFGSQYYLAGATGCTGRIFAPEAWDITTGTSDVIVAVLDTGCNTSLSEFSGRIVPGWNIIGGNTNVMDDDIYGGHGTAVSSIIAATGNNGSWMAGMDWHCKLMPVKVLDFNQVGYDDDCASGIDFAVTNGAKVINLSSGFDTEPSADPLRVSITNAIAHGVIFVTVTHNQGASSIMWPARWPETIAVGATDTNGQKWSHSNYGTNIDLVAPGTNVLVLLKDGTPATDAAGTSFAAPHVAGVAALISAIRPGLNQEQIRTILCAGADDKVSSDPNDTPGYDLYYGWGKLNAYHSLLLAKTAFVEPVVTNSTEMLLQWQCPPNASNIQPYVVQYTNALGTNWQEATNISFTSNMASWTDNTATSDPIRFYRLKLRQLAP